MRSLHCVGRRAARQLVPGAAGSRGRHARNHDRGTGRPPSAAARVRGVQRGPVRCLQDGGEPGGCRAWFTAVARADPRRPRWQSMPLHRVRSDLRISSTGVTSPYRTSRNPPNPTEVGSSHEVTRSGLMQGSISNRSLVQPASLGEALRLLRDEGPLVPMAGCTDLYVALNFGTLEPTRFLDLWRLRELRAIEVRDCVLSIGAMATFTAIRQSPLVRRRLPMLAAAAGEIGGAQIQNRGTLGGNVANASPAGDTLPVLAAADAVVVLARADGERRVPFTAFYTGYRQSVMRPDEIITSID